LDRAFLLRLLAVAAASLVICASALAAPEDSVRVRTDPGYVSVNLEFIR
jgi:hypothetical protein